MSSGPWNTTGTTNEKVQRWISARRFVRDSQARLSEAEAELKQAEADLGKWMVPENAAQGEKFHIWYGDGMLCVEIVGSGYVLSWRVVPKEKGIVPIDQP